MNKGALQDQYEMSQSDVGEALFLKQQTIAKIEQKAIESLKQAFRNRNIDPKDLLND
jgi:DNA-directed RNA polymerase specialized sigma subunit